MPPRTKLRTLLGGVAAACLLAAPLLAACATPLEYGPIGRKQNGAYGYKDRKLTEATWSILVVTPDAALSHDYWDHRARELCGHEGYKKNIFRAIRPTVAYESYGGRPGDFHLEGYLDCAPAPAPAPPAAPPAPAAPAL